MQKKHIYLIIKRYFENSTDESYQNKFRQWMLTSGDESGKEDSLHDLWNELPSQADESTMQDLESVHRKMKHRQLTSPNRFRFSWFMRVAGMILIPLLCSLLTYHFTHKYGAQNINMVEHFVAQGQTEMVVLPDGSEVWINSGSMLIYPERFMANNRTVYLNGEANFSVKKNPNKRFLVSTGHLTIEALGTVFNVQAYMDLPRTTATLEEGRIKVETKGESPESFILSPNEQIIYDSRTQDFTRKVVDAKRVAMWKDGYLIFQESSLGEILHSVEKRYDVIIQFDAGKYEGRTFTVRFTPEDTLEETLDILEEIIRDFNYTIKNSTIYIY